MPGGDPDPHNIPIGYRINRHGGVGERSAPCLGVVWLHSDLSAVVGSEEQGTVPCNRCAVAEPARVCQCSLA